jgi:hypothetical protein
MCKGRFTSGGAQAAQWLAYLSYRKACEDSSLCSEVGISTKRNIISD